MSIKDNYFVQGIPKQETHSWLLHKHYAKRLPMTIEYSFGLYNNDKILQGVCVFGPTAPPVPITLFGDISKYKVRELTRLVINDKHEKNVLSYFVSQCLLKLPIPMCIISFADSGNNHHGYIYQAINWLYTGTGGQLFNYVDSNGKDLHSLTIHDLMKTEGYKSESDYIRAKSIKKIKAPVKYRYVYMLGNKRQIRQMKKDLKLNILSYPKGDNKRYDANYEPNTQGLLF